MVYKCEDCGRDFKYNSKLLEHKNRKTPCNRQRESVLGQHESVLRQRESVLGQHESVLGQRESVPNQCEKCDKIFDVPWRLKRHMESCKGDPKQCQTCKKVFSSSQSRAKHERTVKCIDLQAENDRLRKELDEVKQSQSAPINITINNNNLMIPYAEEGYENIDTAMAKRVWRGAGNVFKLLRMITRECHKDNPNLRITNLRGNTALEWNGEEYDTVPQDEAVENCLSKITERLEEVLPVRKAVSEMVSWVDNECDEVEDPSFPIRRKRGLDSVRCGLYNKA